jgi:hypothetical protein
MEGSFPMYTRAAFDIFLSVCTSGNDYNLSLTGILGTSVTSALWFGYSRNSDFFLDLFFERSSNRRFKRGFIIYRYDYIMRYRYDYIETS